MFTAFFMLMSPVFVLGSLASLAGMAVPKCPKCGDIILRPGVIFASDCEVIEFGRCQYCGHDHDWFE